jgi:hypothetical protein
MPAGAMPVDILTEALELAIEAAESPVGGDDYQLKQTALDFSIRNSTWSKSADDVVNAAETYLAFLKGQRRQAKNARPEG